MERESELREIIVRDGGGGARAGARLVRQFVLV
jgi:hypothetical protein